MSDKPRVQRNKRTGELRVSYDDGASWQPVALPDAKPPEPTPEPAPAPSQPPAAPAPAPQPQAAPAAPMRAAPGPTRGQLPPAFGDFLARATQGAGDFARGVGRGLTFDAMAPASAALTTAMDAVKPAVDDGTGIPREYAAGSPTADLQDSNRRDQVEAEQRSPLATAAGRGLGMATVLAPTVAAAPAAAAGGAGALGQALVPAVGAGVLARGGQQMDERKALGQYLGEVLDPKAVAFDATVGLGVPAIARGVTDAASAAAPALRGNANRMRAAASGAYGGELKKLREAKGPMAADELGAAIESTGIRPQGVIPRSARSYMEGSERVREELGDTIGKSLTQFDDLNVRTPRAQVDTALGAAAKPYSTGITGPSSTKRATNAQLREELGARYGDELKPTELFGLKRELDDAAGFKPGTVRGPSDAAAAEASLDAANAMRGQLDRAVTEQVDIPELTRPYMDAMRNYGHAADANTLASKRVDHELGNQMFSLPTLMSIIPGATAGGASGGGMGALAGGVATGLLTAGVKRYGKDIAANTLRGGQHMAEALAGTAPSAATAAAPLVASRPVRLTEPAPMAPMPSPGGVPMRAPSEAFAQRDPQQNEHTDSALYIDALQDNPELRQRLRRQAEAEQ